LRFPFALPAEPPSSPAGRLAALVGRLRPGEAEDTASAERRLRREIAWLKANPAAAADLGADLRALVAQPGQGAFFAETGVRSALGFWLELTQRLSHALLPPTRSARRLRDALHLVFSRADDHLWVGRTDAALWLELLAALGLESEAPLALDAAGGRSLLDALRFVSHRLAGAALDRELLRADPALESAQSPFLAQNEALSSLLFGMIRPDAASIKARTEALAVLLDQCAVSLVWARQQAHERGVSIRLTYLLARLGQLVERQRLLLQALSSPRADAAGVVLLRALLAAEQQQGRWQEQVGENINLLARNITDHASRHGEHYIAESRADWWGMARSGAGGGMVIAFMALAKLKLAALALAPLTEGLVHGLNYGLGFVLIHLLGFTVATKQPAMTAAAIAATVEEAHPRQLARLADLCQNVVRTQFIAIVGNVGLALPLACVLAAAWPLLFGSTLVSDEKALRLLAELHPFASGALFSAAIAGVGLFFAGLVSGFFDNRARYYCLADRVAEAPRLAWLGPRKARALGLYLDTHYGAILGNLFFGMYLGLVGVTSKLTGIPLDIRHVAFASANLGTASTSLGWEQALNFLPWALAGVMGIALINLAVSFALALYVALKSRHLGTWQILALGRLVLRRFVVAPLSFFRPPH